MMNYGIGANKQTFHLIIRGYKIGVISALPAFEGWGDGRGDGRGKGLWYGSPGSSVTR